jgi:putative DNA primase/helicase
MDTVERDRICAEEVWCECFGGDLKYMRRVDALEINSILIGSEGWKRLNTMYRFGSAYGHQRGFIKT